MKIITSRSNPIVKHLTSLHSAKKRMQHAQCIAEGLRTCTTLISGGWHLQRLYVTKKQREAIEKQLPDTQLPITMVSDPVMAKISTATTPSGVVGHFMIPEPPAADRLGPGIVLANVTNPGNMGTLIRTSVALGHNSVVIVEGTDPWSPKVIHATAGYIAKANIYIWSWKELRAHAYTKDLSLTALVVNGGKTHTELDLSNSLLVVGNEGHGIPHEWIKNCEQRWTLEMPGGTESLNAAIAGGIALYLMKN